jgi:integrase
MSIYLPKIKGSQDKHSRIWWYEFEVAGKRIRGATGCTDKRKARAVELKAHEQAKQAAELKVVVMGDALSLLVAPAALRYFEEVKDKLAGARDAKRDLLRIGEFFDTTRFRRDMELGDITDDDVTALVKWRSAQRAVPPKATKKPEAYPYVSPGTVNHTTVRLQALFTHIKENWKDNADRKIRFPAEPTWKKHKLNVPRKVARVLEGNERGRLDSATRADYEPFVAFASKTALRKASCVSLEWPEVHWGEGFIEKPGKRKPGGGEKIERVPLTPGIVAILKPLVGHHPTRVFTYVADRTRDGRVKGQRYPLTKGGVASMWKRLTVSAKVEKFSFHGLRRDRATEVYRATKDLVAVSHMLNHGSVATTQKYLGVDTRDVAMAMEATDALHGSPKLGPQRDVAMAMEATDTKHGVPTLSTHVHPSKVA